MEPDRDAAEGRLDAERGGYVGLAAAGRAVEDQVLRPPDEVEREYLLAMCLVK